MKKQRKLFFAFLAVIVLFIISAFTLGQYHSALSVIIGFVGKDLFERGYKKFFKEDEYDVE